MLTAFFVRAKHWQLFLLFLVLFSLSQWAARIAIDSGRYRGALNDVALLVMLPMLCYLLWYWVLALFLRSITHNDLKPSMAFFRIAILSSAALLPATMMTRLPLEMLFLLGAVELFFGLYAPYFVARCLAIAETTRPVTFRDFWGSFLLVSFAPIGIWFLQPRINALYQDARAGAFDWQTQN